MTRYEKGDRNPKDKRLLEISSILNVSSNSIKVYAIAYSEICKQKNGVPKYMNSPEVYKTFDVRRLGLADLD